MRTTFHEQSTESLHVHKLGRVVGEPMIAEAFEFDWDQIEALAQEDDLTPDGGLLPWEEVEALALSVTRVVRPFVRRPAGAVRRLRARSSRRARRQATVRARASGDPDPDGDPDAVSPELGRFLDWLADEALREAFRS